MRRFSVPLAVATATIFGCAAFVALLPWGDPCSFVTPPGECCCNIMLSPLQENFRNAGFGGVCVLAGLIAGLLTRSRPLIAGALSPLLSYLLGYFAAHWVYGIGWPQHAIPWTAYLIHLTGGAFAGMAALGAIGAALSRFVRLTTASSAA